MLIGFTIDEFFGVGTNFPSDPPNQLTSNNLNYGKPKAKRMLQYFKVRWDSHSSKIECLVLPIL